MDNGWFFLLLSCFLFVIDCISQWPALETNTVGPYTLSLKSNGGIIMIAAISPSKLVVTSKFSIRSCDRRTMSHAQAGEDWLKKHLESKGKTEADLAAKLWESKFTAVTEVILIIFFVRTFLFTTRLTFILF